MSSPSPTVALVVEDEPLIMMEAVDILEGDGFRVLEAWSADRALALLEEQGPVDLLFTDVHMPGDLDGFALARAVRDRFPGTAIVICSGHVKPGPEDLPEGAVFIDKPFSPALVRQTIRRTLAA
jgi:two-component system, response regulator PdtaR